MKRYFTYIFFFLGGTLALAQSGGDAAYDFLNLTNSARVASLGGQQISIDDNDLNFVFHNPALLSSEMDENLVLNYVNYFSEAKINYGYVAYAKSYGSLGNFAAGLHYINYGKFDRSNPEGDKYGSFTAADYALNLFYSKSIFDSLLNIGANLKPVYSDLDKYTSFALALDLGISYSSKDKLFNASLVFKNMGAQIKKYYPDQSREKLPFEIQLGISQKLRHAPFRFSILAQHLETPNLRYTTESDKNDLDLNTGQPKEEDKFSNAIDNIMRHAIIGVEFIPSKNFHIRLGYNYKRRQELKLTDKPGMTGLSYGFGIRIKKFHISYGRASYHLAGASNHFSVSTNLSELGKNL